MIFLLDTHVLLWWLADDASLPKKARVLMADPTNALMVSAASAWEISIKRALKKIKVPDHLDAVLIQNHIQALPITVRHALAAGNLPKHHEDPFDRMLIAQASLDGLTLLTHDRTLRAYGSFITVV